METKNLRITYLCVSFLLIMSFFIFNANISDKFINHTNYNHNGNLNEDNYLGFSDYSLTEYSGIGKPQNVTEYGRAYFTNNDLDLDNEDNASIIVPENWKANEVVCNISSIIDYDNLWVNETFDMGIDSSYWTNYTDRPENVTFGWHNDLIGENDSIFIRFEEAETNWNNIDSHINYTINIPRTHAPFEYWNINFKYWAIFTNSSWMPQTGGASVYFELYINDVPELSYSRKPSDLDNNTVYPDNVPLFTAEQYDMSLPGTISLVFGVDFGNSGINPTGFFKLFYDNITLTLSTLPKPTDINLNITDITNSYEETNINDIGPGEGTVTLNNIWEGEVGGKNHIFTFNSNSSGRIIINTKFYVKATSIKNTKTQLDHIGSEFQVENNTKTTWTIYIPITIPGTYYIDYYFNISKPINWNITQVINPYNNDKINDTIGAGYGNSSLIVPNDIVLNGLWKIVANAPNYVKEVKIFKKDSSIWKENNTIKVMDKIKINTSIETNQNPDIQITNASLLIFCPNGSLWYKENSTVDPNGFVEFSEINLDFTNTSIGEYTAQVRWNNNDKNMTQVGLYILKFEVHTDSLLKRSNFHTSKKILTFSGDIVLIKVNYSDFFTKEGIIDATVNYTIDNDTKIEGFMIYQGGGIYTAEIDTTYLQRGIYNVTISARKQYYQSQNNVELFEIEVQLYTTLERYDYPTFVQMKDNATVKFCYRDSYGIGILDATIKLSINQDYIVSIDDLGDGNYTIIFNTEGFSTLGLNEISFNFSSTGYETQINTLQFELIEQYIEFSVYINSEIIQENSYIDAMFKEDIKISIRVFATIEEVYLTGGNITWKSDNFNKNIIEGDNSWFNDTIPISSNNFSSGLNFVLINFEQEYYKPTNFGFQILINEQKVNISTFINGHEFAENSIEELTFNEEIDISVKVFAEGERVYLSGAKITFISDNYNKDLTETVFPWYNISIVISSSYFSSGISYVYLKFELENYTTDIFSFQFLIKIQKINLTVLVNSEKISENHFLNFTFNDELSISAQSYATAEKIYLTEGIMTFVTTNYEKNCTGYETYWYNTSISCSPSIFSLGINYVYLRFQKENYSTTTFSFQIIVHQIDIIVSTIGFEDPIEADPGDKITMQIKLTESRSDAYIENATISYYIEDFKGGYFEYIENGIYELKLKIPNDFKGNHKIFLLVTKEGGVYKVTEKTFIISIKEQPNNLIWVILAAFLIVISILG
ncbi:MAG: hypothetical protein ACFFHD_13455, partial [Promethearchaeota archaeon]